MSECKRGVCALEYHKNHGRTNTGLLGNAMTTEAVRRMYGDDLVTHVQVSRNFGLLGGWLRCEFLTLPNGSAVGHAVSRIEYPHV